MLPENKSLFMLVYIHRNYNYPNLLRQTPDHSGRWKDFEFTFEDIDEADCIVVLNHPIKNIQMKCLPGGTFLIVQEPPYSDNQYFKLHFRFYDVIVSGFQGDRIINKQASLPWHVNKSYDELINISENALLDKKNKVSWITSNNNIFPAHKTRLDFVDFLKNEEFCFDLFGRGFQPLEDKFDGLFPYKYSIAAENYIGKNYFTEKIIDAYLSWTMPIYYGSENITDFFPPESMIQVDLKNKQESLEKIEEAIANKLWDKNIEAIKYARDLVLNKYQLFPMLSELIESEFVRKKLNKRKDVFLPQSGLTKIEELKRKIKIGLSKNN